MTEAYRGRGPVLEVGRRVGGPITTRLTTRLGIAHPIVSAPMGGVAGGALAAAVSASGALGMIGAGHATRPWLEKQFTVAADARVGCGFIAWQLAGEPGLLELALERHPAALMLSFGDIDPFAARVKDADVPLMCQVSSLREAARAIDRGADVLIAQGREAGGHGRHDRSTMALVPEICDLVVCRGADTPVLAAGGIADGRGLAAALMLGAAGALIGTRFCATAEALVSPLEQERVSRATGDDTVTTRVYDEVRGVSWPAGYTSRVLRSAFTAAWHDGTAGPLSPDEIGEAADQYRRGMRDDDEGVVSVTAGEAVGLISRPDAAGTVVEVLLAEAIAALETAPVPEL